MIRNQPLLLLHGAMMSADVWADVIPLLTDRHEVIAPTAMGHRGGPPLVGKASIAALTDETERVLDARGLDRVHVAGNSLGGWMAIELARRGRALSVCAFSPAGAWTVGATDELRATALVRRNRLRVQLAWPMARALTRVARLRRLAMRDAAEHGELLSPGQVLDAMRDVAKCPAAEDILAPCERLEPLDPLPCPVALVWSGNDRILPPQIYGATARRRLPQARYLVLPDVGHVPMIDDPRGCADAILATTKLANACQDQPK
jgi:pimeloyl-ACP methyl ester carboxylesterase